MLPIVIQQEHQSAESADQMQNSTQMIKITEESQLKSQPPEETPDQASEWEDIIPVSKENFGEQMIQEAKQISTSNKKQTELKMLDSSEVKEQLELAEQSGEELSLQAIYNKLVMEQKTLQIPFQDQGEFHSLRTSLQKKFSSTRKIFEDAGLPDANEGKYLQAKWNGKQKIGTFRVVVVEEKGGKIYNVREL